MPQDSSDEQLDFVASVLDDIFRIPGTNIRFGLDAIVAWVPGIGDGVAGTASFLIVFACWRRGARAITLVRMMANVLLETTVGATPYRRHLPRYLESEQAELSFAAPRERATWLSHWARLDVPRNDLGHCHYCGGSSSWHSDLDIEVPSLYPKLNPLVGLARPFSIAAALNNVSLGLRRNGQRYYGAQRKR